MASPQLSPKKYIIRNCRSLPIHECYISQDWDQIKLTMVFISRKMKSGNFCVGLMMVDLNCLGVKDATYKFNLQPNEYEEFKNDIINSSQNEILQPADYNLAHNIVYEAIEFAHINGFKPHKEFDIVKFFLQEDDESIDLMDVPLGDELDGLPVVFSSPQQPNNSIITSLEKRLGQDGFHIIFLDDNGNEIKGESPMHNGSDILKHEEFDEDFDEDFIGDDSVDYYYSEEELNWEENDPEVLVEYSEDRIKNSTIGDTLENRNGFTFQHPLSEEEFMADILELSEEMDGAKRMAVKTIIDEFNETPISRMSLPTQDDPITKIYCLVEDGLLDQDLLMNFNVWEQGIEIVDKQRQLPDQDPDVEMLVNKAMHLLYEDHEDDAWMVVKQIEEVPDSKKNETSYILMDVIADELNDPQMNLRLMKQFYDRLPSIRSFQQYCISLAKNDKHEELIQLLGSCRIKDLYGTHQLTIPELNRHLTILLDTFSQTDPRYGLEIMRIAKGVPSSHRELFMEQFNFYLRSLLLKTFFLNSLTNKIGF